jgi:hypothetical protein
MMDIEGGVRVGELEVTTAKTGVGKSLLTLEVGDRVKVVSAWSALRGRLGRLRCIRAGVYYVDLDAGLCTLFHDIPFGEDELELV